MCQMACSLSPPYLVDTESEAGTAYLDDDDDSR